MQFGVTGDRPLSGDWNGDGIDTVGVYTPAQGRFSFRNTNTAGAAELSFVFGAPNLQPLEGDWDGDGVDTVGFYLPSTGEFFLINLNAGGNADLQFVFWPTSEVPVAGDWNADLVDTVGVVIVDPADGRKLRFLLANVNAAGPESLSVQFGNVGELAVVGNWDGQ